MNLRAEGLTDENLDQVFAFIRTSNPFAQATWGWDAGRFVDWRWGANALRDAEHPGWFADHCKVYRSGRQIRAVLIVEAGARDACVVTDGEDVDAVTVVLDRLLAERKTTDLGVNLDVLDNPAWLDPILVRMELTEERETGHEWEFDLSDVAGVDSIPDGFTIETLQDERADDFTDIAGCISAAFGTDRSAEASLLSLSANPLFRPELSVFARSPDERIVSYARGTVDPTNGVCGIDPVCTHPDFQQMGLGRAVVQACFRTQLILGGRFCYIGSAAEPAPGTYLYRALGPSHRANYSSWT